MFLRIRRTRFSCDCHPLRPRPSPHPCSAAAAEAGRDADGEEYLGNPRLYVLARDVFGLNNATMNPSDASPAERPCVALAHRAKTWRGLPGIRLQEGPGHADGGEAGMPAERSEALVLATDGPVAELPLHTGRGGKSAACRIDRAVERE